MTVIFLALAVLVTAISIEFYKKIIRGTYDEQGNPKTKAKSWEVYIIAFIFSLPWGAGLNYLQRGNWYICLLWTVGIYAMQYFVDMALVKKTINGLLKRIGG